MQVCGRLFCQGICELLNYIIPIPGAPPAGIAGAGSLMSATTDSVVNNVEATLVAFCNALLVNLSRIKDTSFDHINKNLIVSIEALANRELFNLLTITAPSRPALDTNME